MSSASINEHLLDVKLGEIAMAKQFSPGIITELRTLVETADDYDLFRLNPIQFAAEKSIDVDDCINLFLYAAKYGLFEMEWHMLCAFCGHIVDSLQQLSKVNSHFICDFCGAENNVSLDDYIHVSINSPKGSYSRVDIVSRMSALC